MGKREERDSAKVRAGKPILDIVPKYRFIDYILCPYRAWQQKRRQAEIRKSIVETTPGVSVDPKDTWVYEAVEGDDGRKLIAQDSWVTDLLSEDNPKDKGE